MKKIITRTLSVVLLFICVQLSASHNRAGYITYKRIPPYTGFNNAPVYNYSITVVKYFDDDGCMFVPDRCVDTVYFGDGTKGIAPRVNGSVNCNCGTVSSVAATCGSLISADPNFRVKESIYSVIHTYSGAGSYLLESSDPNRNAGINNIPNSDQIGFYLHSLLVISNFSQNNSSPVLTNVPIGRAYYQNCLFHNLGATDADGDSLAYELVDCGGLYGQSISGFTQPGGGAANSVFLVSGNGTVSWCSPQIIDEFATAIKIKEFRKNTSAMYILIGYIVIDMQILVTASAPTSLAENNDWLGLQVYPNPFTTQLLLKGISNERSTLDITVYSSQGKLLIDKKYSSSEGQCKLDLETLEPGMYMLKVKTTKGILSRKIVKQ